MKPVPRSVPLSDQSRQWVAYEYDQYIVGQCRHMVARGREKVWMTHTNDQDGAGLALRVARALNMLCENVERP